MGVSIQSPPVVRESYTWVAQPAPAGAIGATTHDGTGSFSCTCSGSCSQTITCQDGESCTCMDIGGAYDCQCVAK